MVVQQRTSKFKEGAAFEMLCSSVIVKYIRELPSKEDAAFEMHLPSCLWLPAFAVRIQLDV